MSNFLEYVYKFVQNTNKTYATSCLGQRVKTQFYLSVTFLLWGWAAGLHLLLEFNNPVDSLFAWVFEILIASSFAIGFGWHLHKFITLKEEEKRGKESINTEELRAS